VTSKDFGFADFEEPFEVDADAADDMVNVSEDGGDAEEINADVRVVLRTKSRRPRSQSGGCCVAKVSCDGRGSL